MTGAFGVFMMRQFFLSLPDEILEAAKIDGASVWTTYRTIALPLAKPAMAALGVIMFLLSWNAYFMPLIFISSLERSTMPLALVLMLGPYRFGQRGHDHGGHDHRHPAGADRLPGRPALDRREPDPHRA